MPPVTRFGLELSSFTARAPEPGGRFERLAAAATTAERSGFDSLWVPDQFFATPVVGRIEEPLFEAYTLLGALAARTSRARLGAMVTGVGSRPPAVLAKQVTALDVVSGGRAVLGIGAAWYDDDAPHHDDAPHGDEVSHHEGRGDEQRAPGVDSAAVSERFERLEEALQICRAMFREDAPSFEGRFYRIRDAVNRPRPRQSGGPPIVVGGNGERHTLRLAAQYADACTVVGDLATVRHKLEVVDHHCEAVGRDPARVTKTRLGTLVIGETEAQAERLVASFAADRGRPEVLTRAGLTAGGPDRVREQVAAFFEAGVDGLVFGLPYGSDLATVTLAGETLAGASGPRERAG